MRVLITRPREEAVQLARRIEAMGFETCVEPLICIRHLVGVRTDWTRAQAVVFTSANGVRALVAEGGCPRDTQAFAVGAATAAAARAAGFRQVIEGPGTVEGLAPLIVANCTPEAGTIVHVSGSAIARDLVPLLEASGLAVDRAVLYEAIPAPRLSAETEEMLVRGAIDATLFFSPRTARVFVSLVHVAGLDEKMKSVIAVALSPAVADVLTSLASTVAPHQMRSPDGASR